MDKKQMWLQHFRDVKKRDPTALEFSLAAKNDFSLPKTVKSQVVNEINEIQEADGITHEKPVKVQAPRKNKIAKHRRKHTSHGWVTAGTILSILILISLSGLAGYFL